MKRGTMNDRESRFGSAVIDRESRFGSAVIDIGWGLVLALLVMALLLLGTSGPKFIYIDF